MLVRISVPTLFGAAALIASAAALAAPAKEPKPVVVANYYTTYDRAIDPLTASIRAVLLAPGDAVTKRDAPAIVEYYRQQGYAPSWTADGKLTERALKIIARIKQADTDGLNPAAYRTPNEQIGQAMAATEEAVARAEVSLTQAIIAFARDAHSGRLDPGAVSENFAYAPHVLDPIAVLSGLAGAADPEAMLDGFNPKHPEFAVLKAKLAELRAAAADRPPAVPPGPTLKPGAKDPRVLVLRQRLNVTTVTETSEVHDPEVYDPEMVEAVKLYQQTAGLKADGIVGPGTLGVMNAASVDHVGTVIANMERWRWMPKTLGNYYVRVNIPNFNLDIYRNGKVAYTTRIVVGTPQNQTPVFSDEIEHVIVNPVWNVPESIAVKEMLPGIMANPAAALNGYQVFANIGGRFRAVDPYMVDWRTVNMKNIQIKQPPGEKNALGSIKFMFPNPFAVYLHDTPSKSLFQKDYRAFSHGCMRVMDPWSFAEALLSNEPTLTVAKLRTLIGGREQQVGMEKRVPVHITYFTAWVDADGKLQVRGDVYGHDTRVKRALGVS